MRLTARIGESLVDSGQETSQLLLRIHGVHGHGAALGLQALIGDVQSGEDRKRKRIRCPRCLGHFPHPAIDNLGQLMQVRGVAVPAEMVGPAVDRDRGW